MGGSLEELSSAQTASGLCPCSPDDGRNTEILLNWILSNRQDPWLFFGAAQRVPHEGQDIRLLLNDLGDGLARTVPGFRFDSDQNRIGAPLCRLQCGGEFERVTRYDPVVVIARRDQSWRIATPR